MVKSRKVRKSDNIAETLRANLHNNEVKALYVPERWAGYICAIASKLEFAITAIWV